MSNDALCRRPPGNLVPTYGRCSIPSRGGRDGERVAGGLEGLENITVLPAVTRAARSATNSKDGGRHEGVLHGDDGREFNVRDNDNVLKIRPWRLRRAVRHRQYFESSGSSGSITSIPACRNWWARALRIEAVARITRAGGIPVDSSYSRRLRSRRV